VKEMGFSMVFHGFPSQNPGYRGEPVAARAL
jgi:hypothetical protein